MTDLEINPRNVVVQVTEDALVLENTGWFPVISFARRSTDDAIVLEVRDWGGGTGTRPPTGWITDDGSLTQDVGEAASFPSSDIVVTVRGEGNATGQQIAMMAIPSGTAVGATTADWADALSGYTIANGLPSDTDAQLHTPETFPVGQWGFRFSATQLDSLGNERSYTPLFIPIGAYGDHIMQLAEGGQALLLRYIREAGGIFADGDHFIVRVLAGAGQDPIDADVTLRVNQAVTGAGSAGLDQGGVDSRIRAIVEDFAEVGNDATLPLTRFGDGIITLEKLAQSVRDAIAAGGGGGGMMPTGGTDVATVNRLIAAAVEDFAEVAASATIPPARFGANTISSDKLTQSLRDAIAMRGGPSGGLTQDAVQTLIGTQAGTELSNIVDTAVDLLLALETVTASDLAAQQDVALALPGSIVTTGGAGVIQHRDYDNVIVDYDDILALSAGTSGTALGTGFAQVFRLKEAGSPSAVTMSVGRTATNSPLVSYSVAGTYHGAALRDVARKPAITEVEYNEAAVNTSHDFRFVVGEVAGGHSATVSLQSGGDFNFSAVASPGIPVNITYTPIGNTNFPSAAARWVLAFDAETPFPGKTLANFLLTIGSGGEVSYPITEQPLSPGGSGIGSFFQTGLQVANPVGLANGVGVVFNFQFSDGTYAYPRDRTFSQRTLAVAGLISALTDHGLLRDYSTSAQVGAAIAAAVRQVSGATPPIANYPVASTATIAYAQRAAAVNLAPQQTVNFGIGWGPVIDAGQAHIHITGAFSVRSSVSGNFVVRYQPQTSAGVAVGSALTLTFEVASGASPSGTFDGRAAAKLPRTARQIQVLSISGAGAAWAPPGGSITFVISNISIFHDTVADVRVAAGNLVVTDVDGLVRNFPIGTATTETIDDRVRMLLAGTPPDPLVVPFGNVPTGGPSSAPNLSFTANRTTGRGINRDLAVTVNPKREVVVRYQLTADDAPAAGAIFAVSTSFGVVISRNVTLPNNRTSFMAQIERVRGSTTTTLFRTNSAYVRFNPNNLEATLAPDVLFLDADLQGSVAGAELQENDIVQVAIVSYVQLETTNTFNLDTGAINQLVLQQLGQAGPAGARGPVSIDNSVLAYRATILTPQPGIWVASGYLLPDEEAVEWLLINEGGTSAGGLEVGHWLWVRNDELQGLAPAVPGTAATAATGVNTTFATIFGRTTAGELLLAGLLQRPGHFNFEVREVRPEIAADPQESTYTASLAAAQMDLATRTVALAVGDVQDDHDLTLGANGVTFGAAGEYDIALSLNLETTGVGMAVSTSSWVAVILERRSGSTTTELLKDSVHIPQTSNASGLATGPTTINYGNDVSAAFEAGDTITVKVQVEQRRLATAMFKINSGIVRIVNAVGVAKDAVLPATAPPIGVYELGQTAPLTVAYASRAEASVPFVPRQRVVLHNGWNGITDNAQTLAEVTAQITGRANVSGPINVMLSGINDQGAAVSSVIVPLELPSAGATTTLTALATAVVGQGVRTVVIESVDPRGATWAVGGTFSIRVARIRLFEEYVADVEISGTDLAITRNSGRTSDLAVSVDLAPVESRLDDLELFEGALRTTNTIQATVAVVVAARNTAVRLGTLTLPPPEPGKELTVTVAATGDQTVQHTFRLAELAGKATITGAGAALNDANSVRWDSVENDQNYRLAHAGDGNIYFGSNAGDTYNVSVTAHEIDTTDYLDEDQKLPVPAADQWLKWNTGATALENTAPPIVGRRAGVFELHDGPFQGLSITSTNASATGGLLSFTNGLDLDDYMHGEIHAEVVFRMQRRGDTTVSFDSADANDTTHSESGIVFASVLRAQSAYTVGGDIEGVLVTEAQLYKTSGTGAGPLGTARLYLGHNAQNQVGYIFEYDGGGTAGATLEIVGELVVTFTPTDPGPIVTFTTRGRLVARTTALPTAAVTRGQPVAPGGDTSQPYAYQWINRASGYNDNSQGNQHSAIPALLFPPSNPPTENVSGFAFRSLVAGVAVQTIYFPWGPGVFTNSGPGREDNRLDALLFFVLGGINPGGARILIRYTVTTDGYVQFNLLGEGAALPAQSTVEVYESGIFVA